MDVRVEEIEEQFKNLQSPLCEDAKKAIINKIWNTTMHFKRCESRMYSRRIQQYRGFDILLPFCLHPNTELKLAALRCVGNLCFANYEGCEKVSQWEGFEDVINMLSGPYTDEFHVKYFAIYLLNNVTFGLKEIPKKSLRMIPHLMRLLKSMPNTLDMKRDVVSALNILAYQKSARRALVKAGAVKALISVVQTPPNINVEQTSAAICIANVIGEFENHPALSAAGSVVLGSLVQAFNYTLKGKPYPPGSNEYYTDWKLAMGLANLANSDANQTVLAKAGIVDLLLVCLDKNSDPRLVDAVYETLFRLSFSESIVNHYLEQNKILDWVSRDARFARDKIRKRARKVLENVEKSRKRRRLESAKKTIHCYCWATGKKLQEMVMKLRNHGHEVFVLTSDKTSSSLSSHGRSSGTIAYEIQMPRYEDSNFFENLFTVEPSGKWFDLNSRDGMHQAVRSLLDCAPKPKPKAKHMMTVDEVCQWVSNIGLQEYSNRFREEHFDGRSLKMLYQLSRHDSKLFFDRMERKMGLKDGNIMSLQFELMELFDEDKSVTKPDFLRQNVSPAVMHSMNSSSLINRIASHFPTAR